MVYRAEIDGLRALAVVPVILFHAGFEQFSGGFVGVDVFFVISGYLITTILIEDIEKKRFSIANFYERRARRILPALFFVMLVCIPFAWIWMLPSQMIDFSQSLVAVSLFASNILFWHESGYFAAAAEEKPLLHTWSLAVEEQYYVLFPIFLILAWRFGKNRVFWMIVVMAAMSLLLSEWGWRNKAIANFYLAPTRAWELFAGSIAAFIVQKKGVQKNNFLATFGLVAIIFSIFFYDETTPFPSVYALVPVLGVVCLLLYATKETLTAKLLSTKGFVGIGLISYSAYLWHQPLFAFARIHSLEHPSIVLMLTLSFISVLLAYLSWRYVEKPFRDMRVINRTQIFISLLVLFAGFLMMGSLGHYSEGFPKRIHNDVLTILNNVDNESLRLLGKGCHLSTYVPEPLPLACGNKPHDDKIEVLLIGDSHLDAIGLQIMNKLASVGISAYAISYGGCIPISGITLKNADATYQCPEYNKAVRNFAHKKNIKTIVLIARFPLYLSGERYNNGEGGVELGDPNPVDLIDTFYFEKDNMKLTREERVAQQIRSDLKILSDDYNVIVFTPTPEVGWNVPSLFTKASMVSNDSEYKKVVISHSFYNYLERTSYFSNILKSIKSDNLYIYDIHRLFCDEQSGRCLSNFEDNLYYRDDDHLSIYGASIVAQDFLKFYHRLIDKESSNQSHMR